MGYYRRQAYVSQIPILVMERKMAFGGTYYLLIPRQSFLLLPVYRRIIALLLIYSQGA